MGRKKPRKTTVVLMAILVLLSITYVANAVHLYTLEQDLAALAEDRREFILPGQPEGDASNVTSTITVSKTYAVFGPTTAKIKVFTRYPAGTETGIGYSEVAYVYTYEDGDWREMESAMCAGEECRKDATLAFASR